MLTRRTDQRLDRPVSAQAGVVRSDDVLEELTVQMCTRMATRKQPLGEGGKPEVVSLQDLLGARNVVLLGDPGAGKTHAMREACDLEDGIFFTARSFVGNADRKISGRTVYIDGLDEKRPRASLGDGATDIIRLLREFSPKSVRLSCRSLDWLGDTDLELFRPLFDVNGGYAVAELNPLTDAEVDHIVMSKGIDVPSSFRMEATERGLSSLLSNPQTLIMLCEVVRNGTWPNTKTDLFRLATDLLLEEANPAHARTAPINVTVASLRNAAGAASAAMLISDSVAISLIPGAAAKRQPAYTEVPSDEAQATYAALTRRLFGSFGTDMATYKHRTLAEFMGGEWLVERVRNGLPLERVVSLLCVNDVPATELRGLYAWIATLAGSSAPYLVEADPLGIIQYGDPASMMPEDRKRLLSALVKLSEADPYFRAKNWDEDPLGALSGPEMENEFRAVLSTQGDNFHLRSLVLDAIGAGFPIPALIPDLTAIFTNEQASYRERWSAYKAVCKMDFDSAAAASTLIKKAHSSQGNSLRLRLAAISRYYGVHFDNANVAEAIALLFADNSSHSGGEVWFLAKKLPIGEIPEILDLITARLASQTASTNFRRSRSEVDHFVSQCVTRWLGEEERHSASDLWRWLCLLRDVNGPSSSAGSHDAIRDWLKQHQDVVNGMFEASIASISEGEGWRFWPNFTNAVMYSHSPEHIAASVLRFLEAKSVFSKVDATLLELGIGQTSAETQECVAIWERLFALGMSSKDLQVALDRSTKCEIESWRVQRQEGEQKRKFKLEVRRLQGHEEFDKVSSSISLGRHFGWLQWIGNVYYGHLSEAERDATPQFRLAEELGAERVQIALSGLKALTREVEPQPPGAVAEMYYRGRYHGWWNAYLAGFDELWSEHPSLSGFSDRQIAYAVAINLLRPTLEREHGWRDAVVTERPDLARSIYSEIAIVGLTTNSKRIEGIYELCEGPDLIAGRAGIAIDLITQFPRAPAETLRTLIFTALAESENHERLAQLSVSQLAQRATRGEARALWWTLSFILQVPGSIQGAQSYFSGNNKNLWPLMTFSEATWSAYSADGVLPKSVEQLLWLVRTVGRRYENCGHPLEGWSGNQNPWDAAECVRRLIDELSGDTSDEAASGLREVANDARMLSYRNHTLHGIANQAVLMRQAKFLQPDWVSTVRALAGKDPAHMPDLLALSMANLRGVAREISSGNTDVYKAFWNEDSYGRITAPKPEETGRDRLVDLLRSRIGKLGTRVEPEGHMSADKRADMIVLANPSLKLPVEIKRDYHSDLWTARENQLEQLYVRDPDAAGYGIYLVLWYGESRTRAMASPPKHLAAPKTAAELEHSLRTLISPADRHRLQVVVVDVTKPVE